ncbi:MAG: hypothetical protein CM1200mP32_05030 [Methanobacteriota archaeon]|nr:MAG: hypothetical protein CM1200mP32_05030 [Euryarchaeota archaeon]
MSDTVELDRASDPQAVRGYAFYDWAKSSFETSVTTAVLPGWFAYIFLKANGLEASVLGMDMTSDAIWSFSVTIAALFVAILAPSLGVIADRRAIKIWWLRILTYLGAGSTFLLAFAPMLGISHQWVWLIVMFLMANVGLNGAGVFYNALLPHLGTDDEMDAISNKAYAYGYLGGGLLLAVHLAMWMTLTGDWIIPFIMASSGVWWLGFACLTFAWVPEPPIENEMETLGVADSAKFAFSELKTTLGQITRFRTLFIYMLAYFFFIDGINTVTALAGIYGVTVLGLTIGNLIAIILVIQFVAAPCAIGFTKLAERTSTHQALSFSWLCGSLSSLVRYPSPRWFSSRMTSMISSSIGIWTEMESPILKTMTLMVIGTPTWPRKRREPIRWTLLAPPTRIHRHGCSNVWMERANMSYPSASAPTITACLRAMRSRLGEWNGQMSSPYTLWITKQETRYTSLTTPLAQPPRF